MRTADGRCFAERNRETGSVTVTDGDRSLHATLEDHIAERVRVENGDGETGTGEGEVDEEIEQRLSALGYRE